MIDRCRRRVVAVETQRGDRETAASALAMDLRWTGGLDTVAPAVLALGKTHFARTFGWMESGASRQETLSHLVVRSVPRAEDTPEAFAGWAREAGVSEGRLVELALYAPQWAAHVNHVLRWPGFEGAVWWIQAHTKDDRSWRLREMKELWAAEVSERTPLPAADLTEGAVDVEWFRQVYGEIGPERWRALDAAAKYAASSAGRTRAQLFARAMAGLVTRDELFGRIDGSRHQDAVRAVGLLPLAEGEAGQQDLLERYLRLEEFRRQARKFGSQRQQSEGRAVAIGLANLARTAGYRDPQRLQWAMEQQAVADLARGPVVLERGEVTLTLAVDADGVPSLSVEKKGKPVKTLPAALKKDGEVEALKSRLQELKRQRSRVREALEDAMCRGDRFTSSGLARCWRTRSWRRASRGWCSWRKAPQAIWRTRGARWWEPRGRGARARRHRGAAHRPSARPAGAGRLGRVAARVLPRRAGAAVQTGVPGTLPDHRRGARHQPLTAIRRPPGEPAAGAGAAWRARVGSAAGGGREPDVPRRGPDGSARLPGGVLHTGRHRGADARGGGVRPEG